MQLTLNQQLIASLKRARQILARLSPAQKEAIEKAWDVEHAYYSSALEGSQMDRQDFEKLAQKVD